MAYRVCTLGDKAGKMGNPPTILVVPSLRALPRSPQLPLGVWWWWWLSQPCGDHACQTGSPGSHAGPRRPCWWLPLLLLHPDAGPCGARTPGSPNWPPRTGRRRTGGGARCQPLCLLPAHHATVQRTRAASTNWPCRCLLVMQVKQRVGES